MNDNERPPSRTKTAQDPITTREVGNDETVAQAVVAAVSSASDAEVRELEPLYATVDPDALDAIFGPPRGSGPRQQEGCVAFEYEGREVCVGSDGTVCIY